MPREPRLNPTSGLPKNTTDQIELTRIDGRMLPGLNPILNIAKILTTAIKATTQNPTAHKIMNKVLFIRYNPEPAQPVNQVNKPTISSKLQTWSEIPAYPIFHAGLPRADAPHPHGSPEPVSRGTHAPLMACPADSRSMSRHAYPPPRAKEWPSSLWRTIAPA